MGIQLAVHQENIVALVLGRLDESVLLVGVGGVEIDDLLILVGLVLGDRLAVVLK